MCVCNKRKEKQAKRRSINELKKKFKFDGKKVHKQGWRMRSEESRR